MSDPLDICKVLGIQDSAFSPFLNTGNLYDLGMGRFVPGVKDSTILNGGIGLTNGICGKPQVFKSTQAHGFAINILARYPGSRYIIYDTEFSQSDKERIIRASDLYLNDPIMRERHLEDLRTRVIVINPEDMDLEAFFNLVKKIAEQKWANKKDFTIETPLLDPRTGNPMRMFVPTLVSFDSWSEAHALSSMENLDEKEASDSGNNTWFMQDGRIKKLIMTQMPTMGAKYGIYFILTAHIGKVTDMSGSRTPPSKDMQYTKQGETYKGVGASFSFLVSNVVEARKATPLTVENKESQYRLPGGANTAIHEFSAVEDVVIRCKNNNSGTKMNIVISQKDGLTNALTNYEELRSNKYYGLGGPAAMRNPKCVLTPDVALGRTVCYERLRQPEVARAVELVAQLSFVQNRWTVNSNEVPFDITPEKLAEDLDKTTFGTKAILQSRGFWTYAKHEQEYLSLWDVLAIVKGTYKPKFLGATPVEAPKK